MIGCFVIGLSVGVLIGCAIGQYWVRQIQKVIDKHLECFGRVDDPNRDFWVKIVEMKLLKGETPEQAYERFNSSERGS